MKIKVIVTLLFMSIVCATSLEMLPLNQKWLNNRIVGQYSRGTYLIVLANSYLEPYLTSEQYGGDFVAFKKSQGFDVDVISLNTEGLSSSDPSELKNYLLAYVLENPMLEYVLLVGDINGSFPVPTHFIQSVNEDEVDVTDYPYSFYNDTPGEEDYDVLTPKFIVGRWSIRNAGDFINIKSRTIQYIRRDLLPIAENAYTDSALLVAGNYSNNDGEEIDPSFWPVTPVWTSYWLYDQLDDYGYALIDTVFFHAGNQIPDPPDIINNWSAGRGIINYRGWGNSHGWHFPEFHIAHIQELTHQWKLPVVSSFVCNTGDFGADLNNQGPVKCFAEALTTTGTLNNPQGAVAVIGPSDLDTDTRYNNVICGNYWRALLHGETAELGSALHIGKQSLIDEFPQLAGSGDVVEFYHHIYSVIGDPSLPVWLLTPSVLFSDVIGNTQLHQSFISTMITDEGGNPIEEVVGALIMGNELVGKGMSTPEGYLDIDFDGIPEGSELILYLNKSQFLQKRIDIAFIEDDGTPFTPHIWTAFDVQPVFSTGNDYVESGETVDIQLSIFNPSQISFSPVDISLTSLTDNGFFGSFSTDTLELLPFSTSETNNLFSGEIGQFPISSRIYLQADFSMDGQIIAESTIPITIGPITENDPLAPDQYGYWAYDNFDTDYEEAPVYDWIELNPADGGSGSLLPLDDDSHFLVPLPFDFTYYGQVYSEVTIGSNGWLSLLPCTIDYFWNFSIPMFMGPSGMIAPFMDDMDDNGGTEPFTIFSWYDADNQRFIVQWDNVANGEDDEFCDTIGCIKETFQVILYNPEAYPTDTGDGEILFQYQEIHDIDSNGNYSTIGIESPDQLDGLQYLFCNNPSPGAWWHVDDDQMLTENLAIKFTTNAPCRATGDLNADGAIDILDIVRTVSIIIGINDPTPMELIEGDLSCDGVLDVLDVVQLVAIVLGTPL